LPLDAQGLDTLFRTARTRNAWAEETLPEATLRALYDLLKFGPTSANCSPARFVFVTSAEGKAKLGPLMSEGNQKALKAPCIVIIGHDLAFSDRLPELFPHNPSAQHWFGDIDSPKRLETAFRNGTLQGGYLILAARALGLDCGPMSGFDMAGVDAAFFGGATIRSNFLCAIGHGTDEPFPRSPRLSFEDACTIA
jgi:nitroreductase